MDECGLVLRENKKLAYVYKHGHFMWLHPFLQRHIVQVWNYIACRIFGHDWFYGPPDPDYIDGEWFCCDCCKVEFRGGE